MGGPMFDVATRRELAAMVRDRVEETLDAGEERRFLILAEDCEELAVSLHPTRAQGLLRAA